jgi:geranylgeranyl reductase family protein
LKHDFDIIIAGAGPAGCTLALHLAQLGLKIAVFEKDTFPRAKICGDALSGKVINVLKRLPGDIYSQFLRNVQKQPSDGIRFISPGHRIIDVPFSLQKNEIDPPPGYICSRYNFDRFLFSQLARYENIHVFEGIAIHDVFISDTGINALTQTGQFTANLIVGADGVHSVVRRKLSVGYVHPRHFCLGIRGYYSGVEQVFPGNFIELMFLKPLLPGYFWIFKGNDGLANVGLGLLKTRIINDKIGLSQLMNRLIHDDLMLKPRFSNAKPEGKPQAHPLPLATFPCRRAGNRYLLLGDAGFMVAPFSGEGIGNAMGSAESAVPVVRECFERGDFSAALLSGFELKIKKRFGNEFRIMNIMQRLVRYPGLMDLVVKKAAGNEEIRNMLTAMFNNEDIRARLTRPGFYLKLFVK